MQDCAPGDALRRLVERLGLTFHVCTNRDPPVRLKGAQIPGLLLNAMQNNAMVYFKIVTSYSHHKEFVSVQSGLRKHDVKYPSTILPSTCMGTFPVASELPAGSIPKVVLVPPMFIYGSYPSKYFFHVF